MDDRRRDQRFERDFDIELTDGLRARSVNISSRGIYCVVDEPLPLFSKLHVTVDLPVEEGELLKIECDGVVVRAEPEEEQFNVAIYFLDLDPATAERVERFLPDA